MHQTSQGSDASWSWAHKIVPSHLASACATADTRPWQCQTDSTLHAVCCQCRTRTDALPTNTPPRMRRVPCAALTDQNLLIMMPKSVSVAADLVGVGGPTPGEQMRLLRAASRTYRLLAGIQLSDWRNDRRRGRGQGRGQSGQGACIHTYTLLSLKGTAVQSWRRVAPLRVGPPPAPTTRMNARRAGRGTLWLPLSRRASRCPDVPGLLDEPRANVCCSGDVPGRAATRKPVCTGAATAATAHWSQRSTHTRSERPHRCRHAVCGGRGPLLCGGQLSRRGRRKRPHIWGPTIRPQNFSQL